VLKPQVVGKPVEIIIDRTPRGASSTGQKRNWLYFDRAVGKYVVCIDDDDMVPDYYVDRILKAAEQDPDVITFIGWMTSNGENKVDFVLRLGEKYEFRDGKYYRFPNHIVPMKRERILNFRFPDKIRGEDSDFAYAINDAGVLKTEVHIPEDMYFYLERSDSTSI
jgi:GT2 family glycosyltransferase